MLTAIKRYNVDSMGLMTIAGTETFSHDAMGNPTSYALKTLTWSGKQLTRYYYHPNKNELYDYTYAYDENGLRTQKVLNGVTTSYYYNGTVLMGMVTGSGNSAIHQLFSYDSSGNVVAVDYSSNGGSTFTTYYYLRNAQNDIVKIIDGSGNTVVQYTYDSWGKPISVTGTLASTLGANQPFRYRGDVYDTETGWYYLQSRYYDPSVCRFISADSQFDKNAGIIGFDLYTYCANNPIIYKDSSGESITLACILIGAGIGLIGGAIGGSYVAEHQGYTTDDGWDYWKYVAGFGVAGGAVGALAGWGVAALIPVITKVSIYASSMALFGRQVTGAGAVVSMLRQMYENSKSAIGIGQLKHLINLCKNFDIKIYTTLSDLIGHGNWAGIPHLHVGNARIHIALTKEAVEYLKLFLRSLIE